MVDGIQKNVKGIPPLKISKIGKKAQDKQGDIQKNYMKLISGGIIVNSNYIVTGLNG